LRQPARSVCGGQAAKARGFVGLYTRLPKWTGRDCCAVLHTPLACRPTCCLACP
jgi:hypothetical protein